MINQIRLINYYLRQKKSLNHLIRKIKVQT
jgi:hypothetical protein